MGPAQHHGVVHHNGCSTQPPPPAPRSHLRLALCLLSQPRPATPLQEASLTHGMPVAVRHLESVVRMSEASARMHLREYVAEHDINVAIK